MESVTVYVLCIAVALNFVRDTYSAPVSGLLSGLFGGDDGHPKQQPAAAAPVDINQLLRQYYTAQSEDQMARYNPFGQLNSAASYAQPQQFEAFPQPAAEPYFAYPNSNPFQNPYQNSFAPDPYSQQLYPVYRGVPGQVPSAVDGSGAAAAAAAAEQFTKQLDSFLPRDGLAGHALAGDVASYRSLSAPSQVDARSHSASQVREAVESRPPVASSLVAHRVLPDSDPAEKPAEDKASSEPKHVELSKNKE
ncbi:hypothetical protein ILUMI_24839 [Ignelater luminosus]|uniref:Uncharacterized protein n=1 Tax=Ignelater luminosus TaxID=2038154 RepID=A0A8K0FWG0_IGNLU|nr:hypothetical protein ILUMI_24839 [Ignelater luminosus]